MCVCVCLSCRIFPTDPSGLHQVHNKWDDRGGGRSANKCENPCNLLSGISHQATKGLKCGPSCLMERLEGIVLEITSSGSYGGNAGCRWSAMH